MSIVIIDDDNDDLAIIREIASHIDFPYPVITFSHPEPAIDYILNPEATVKLIIADVNMPKLNGFEVRKKMIDSGEPFSEIPFVFLSTSRTDEDIKKAKAVNVVAYYLKPTTFQAYKDILVDIKNKNGL